MTIKLCNMNFSYPEQPNIPVLNIPSWSVSTGEKVFIHGSSGSGKSTLLNILNGLLQVASGNVTVLGQCVDSMTSKQRDIFRANNIGYVFQQFNLIPYLDAIDNIKLASYFSQSRKKSDVNHKIKALLSQLNMPENDWNKPVNQLSIGQQQRIAIARALINNPSLLIADEPTSSLDQKNRDSFMALLMSIVEEHDITLVFVSHDMSLSSYFTRVESLNDINHVECKDVN